MKQIKKYYAIADYSHVGEWRDAGEAYLKMVYAEDSESDKIKNAKESVKASLVPKLKLFDSLEAAMSYSEDTALFEFPSGVDAFGKSKSLRAKIYQAPVLEVSVSEDSLHEKVNETLEEKFTEIKGTRYRTIPSWQELANNEVKQDKKHTYLEIKNIPENYTVNSIRIQKSDSFIPLMKIPETYVGFFANKQNSILTNVKRPFQDYSGKFFLFHWNRHHTKLADDIVKKLNLLKTPEEAYAYLFEQRQTLIKKYAGIKSNWHTYGIEDLMQGSFLRRIDHALLQLNPYAKTDKQAVKARGLDHKTP